ncbi:MAG: hypothetical protein KY464_10080 [Gemmatimonadetes bacterium]|nr:hypothetical protein [Gemmatimonadota bacterium]
MRRLWRLALAAPVALTLVACDLRERPAGMDAGGPVVPSIVGYAEGGEIMFMHTEASDPQIADTLTKMMRSPVLTVPTLAQTPESARAVVYVFANGIRPRGDSGPLEYQPDVFDAPPGTPGYSPLREVHLVTWTDPSRARVLKAAAEVKEAEARGELTVQRPGVVVNMPFLTWPGGGQR